MKALVVTAFATLSLLPGTAFAQPGGGGGGPSTNWSVTYTSEDGHTRIITPTSDVDTLWWPGPGESSAPLGGFGELHGAGTALCSGTIQIHFRWINTQISPPTFQWVEVTANAQWAGNATSSGSANNAFDDELNSGNYFGNRFGVHLIRKSVNNGEFTLTYSINAWITNTAGLGNAACSVSAAPSTRAVDLNLQDYLVHWRRHLNGETATYQYPDPASSPANPTYLSFSYPRAVMQSVPWEDNDLQVQRNIDFGLATVPAGTSAPGYEPRAPYQMILWFSGSATSLQEAPESYSYTFSRLQGFSGETLPSGLFGNGWDVAPAKGIYNKPYYENITEVPKKLEIEDGHFVESATFDYNWSNGTKGRAVLNVTFHTPADNQELKKIVVYGPPWSNYPWTAYVFRSGSTWSEVGATSAMIDWLPPGIDLVPLATGYGILIGYLGVVFPGLTAEALLIAAWIGTALNIPSAPSQEETLDRSGFAEADTEGRVSPPDWEDVVPPGDPMLLFKWRAEYQPDDRVTYSVADTWNEYGYAGQQVFKSKRQTGPFESSRKRYWYELVH